MINKRNNFNFGAMFGGRMTITNIGTWNLLCTTITIHFVRDRAKNVHFVRIQKMLLAVFVFFGARENKRPKKEHKSNLSKVFYVHNARTARAPERFWISIWKFTNCVIWHFVWNVWNSVSNTWCQWTNFSFLFLFSARPIQIFFVVWTF